MGFGLIESECIRDSENIWVILPSLNDVKEAFSMATSWSTNVKPFLVSCSPSLPASSSLLKLEALQVPTDFYL